MHSNNDYGFKSARCEGCSGQILPLKLRNNKGRNRRIMGSLKRIIGKSLEKMGIE